MIKQVVTYDKSDMWQWVDREIEFQVNRGALKKPDIEACTRYTFHVLNVFIEDFDRMIELDVSAHHAIKSIWDKNPYIKLMMTMCDSIINRWIHEPFEEYYYEVESGFSSESTDVHEDILRKEYFDALEPGFFDNYLSRYVECCFKGPLKALCMVKGVAYCDEINQTLINLLS